MRYKVGDKVVIRKGLIENRYPYENGIGGLFFNGRMKKLCGKTCTIFKITDLVLDEYNLLIDDKKIGWYFNNAMLLPANSLRHLIMTREVAS